MNLNKASLNIVKCQDSQMRRTQLIFCSGIIPGQNQPDILRHVDYIDHLTQWRGPQFVFMGRILIFISAFSDYKICKAPFPNLYNSLIYYTNIASN